MKSGNDIQKLYKMIILCTITSAILILCLRLTIIRDFNASHSRGKVVHLADTYYDIIFTCVDELIAFITLWIFNKREKRTVNKVMLHYSICTVAFCALIIAFSMSGIRF